MEHFVTDEVDRVKIDKYHWVDIKRRMTYGDQQRLTASFVKLQSRTKGETPDIDVDLETGNITLLLINIKGWNLEISPGQVAPVDGDTIRQLDPNVAGRLVSEINSRNQSPKA